MQNNPNVFSVDLCDSDSYWFILSHTVKQCSEMKPTDPLIIKDSEQKSYSVYQI